MTGDQDADNHEATPAGLHPDPSEMRAQETSAF